MNVTAALARLSQQLDVLTAAHTAAAPVDTAYLDRVLRAMCAVYADEGADELRRLLAQNTRLRPDRREPLVRLARNLVERAKRGDSLSGHQAAILMAQREGR